MATGLQTIREEDLHDPQLEGVTDPEQVKTLRVLIRSELTPRLANSSKNQSRETRLAISKLIAAA